MAWGPSLSVNLLHRITRLHNRGIHMASGLRKYDHVSHSRFVIGWLPVSSVIQHRSLVAMYKQYKCNHCLLLSPQIEFGRQSSELQLALQTSLDIICLSARGFLIKGNKLVE